MSPSTKNLRERIEEIVKESYTWWDRDFEPDHEAQRDAVDSICALISGREEEAYRRGRNSVNKKPCRHPDPCKCDDEKLSLAVKGLREAVAGADKDMCVTGTEEGARAASTMNRSMERHLQAFDSKAKEILGESS